jgi:biofilm PGA synthesis N-glycosyltransferase PgaC
MDWKTILLGVVILIQLSAIAPIAFHYNQMEKKSKAQIPPPNSNFRPNITVFIPVRNEIANIESKIWEILRTDYPLEQIKLLIVSSGSDDGTVATSRNLLERVGRELNWDVIEIERLGKSVAVNYVLGKLDTDFLIMVDADAKSQNDSFNLLLDWFVDEKIGAVCGQYKSEINHDDYQYRTRFNTLRVGESVVDSTPIFEGSICCFRTSSLRGKLINEKINADDSQLAMLVRSNGYKAIMDPRIKFTEAISGDTKSRRIRRGQGLVRALIDNIALIFGQGKYSLIFANSLYFYVLFPWIFMISSACWLTIMISIFIINANYTLMIIPVALPFFFILNDFLRTLLSGCFVLIGAQLKLFFGITLEKWMPDRAN